MGYALAMSEADEVAGMEHMEPSQPTARGFEPLRAEPNGFLVHLLNHSDTLSWEGAIPANYEGASNEVMSGLVAADTAGGWMWQRIADGPG